MFHPTAYDTNRLAEVASRLARLLAAHLALNYVEQDFQKADSVMAKDV
jgi:hypothetical protein